MLSVTGMKNREERSKHFFDSGPLMEEDEDLALYEMVSLELTVYFDIYLIGAHAYLSGKISYPG